MRYDNKKVFSDPDLSRLVDKRGESFAERRRERRNLRNYRSQDVTERCLGAVKNEKSALLLRGTLIRLVLLLFYMRYVVKKKASNKTIV